jgi:hypothetical protein
MAKMAIPGQAIQFFLLELKLFFFASGKKFAFWEK